MGLNEHPAINVNYDHQRLLTIHTDGTIERGPRFTTEDEASLEFWNSVAAMFPLWLRSVKDGTYPEPQLGKSGCCVQHGLSQN